MMPRLTNGVDRRGYASVICLNSSSASVLLPLRMKLTARLKSAVAFGDGGPAGPNDVGAGHGMALPTAPAFAPAAPAGVLLPAPALAAGAVAPPGAQLAAPAGVR